jgi:hypothetical protein
MISYFFKKVFINFFKKVIYIMKKEKNTKLLFLYWHLKISTKIKIELKEYIELKKEKIVVTKNKNYPWYSWFSLS